MRAYHASGRRRLACLFLLLTSLLVGCGGAAKDTGTASTNDPKAGARRKEMADYMKNQPPGGTSKP